MKVQTKSVKIFQCTHIRECVENREYLNLVGPMLPEAGQHGFPAKTYGSRFVAQLRKRDILVIS